MQHRDNPLLCAIYATARRELERARVAETLAKEHAWERYEGGRVGEKARRLAALYDAKRSMHIGRALDQRNKASALRLYLRGLDATRAAS